MPTRQYIGARYVPKFYQNSVDGSTQWEENVVYDPLIWVTLQNGHIYLSKKQVPATVGTPASNIDYWLDVGSYDGYIEDLQQQIDDMNDGTVSGSLQNQIDTMNDGSSSGSLQNQINTMKDGSVNGTLQYQINAVKDLATDRTLVGKQVAVYADSYGNPSNAFAAAWVNALSTYTGKTVHNVSASGNTMNMIQLAFDDYADADLYVVVGGINDWNNTADLNAFKTAITNMVNKIRAVNPSAEIMFVTMPIVHHAAGSGITVYYPVDYYRQVMWQTCAELHCMVCSGLNIENLVMEADGIHPTAASSPNIANAIIRSYKAGGDTRDYHDEYIQNWNNTFVMCCLAGQPYLQISRTMNFTAGGTSQALDWLNNDKLVYYPKAYGWRRETGGVFQWFMTTNSTGISISAQRQTNEDSSGVTGEIGIYSDLIPLMMKGLAVETS